MREATLEGIVDRIVYTNDENGYTVARFQLKSGRETVTIVGNLPDIRPGETLRISGLWLAHRVYGEQFQVESCLPLIPTTLLGIERYLGSGLIKGIGPIMARRLVQKFGPDTLHVIENEGERLLEVGGIGEGRARMIEEAWQSQKGTREVMIFLQAHGVSAAYSAKIFKQYGQQAVALVQENPYRLAAEIPGIGFKTADKIAQGVGVDPQSPLRAQAGILYLLKELSNEGHVCYPVEELIERGRETLGLAPERIQPAISELHRTKKLVIEPGSTPLAYLPDLYRAEVEVGQRLGVLTAYPHVPLHSRAGSQSPGVSSPGPAVLTAYPHVPLDSPSGSQLLDTSSAKLPFLTPHPQASRPAPLEEILSWLEEKARLRLAEGQRQAVREALSHKILVITGGPGTGKTTTIHSLLQTYERLNRKVLLSAPTGRAAKRLSETTHRPARTIHRLLEFSFQKGGFQRDEHRPLEAGAIIIDEASMIDLPLMQHLVRAIPPASTLILVGDVNQLPSVGPGNVLRDIILSGRVKVIELTEIFRQARQSLIVTNAHRIHRGIFPFLPEWEEKGERRDFYFIPEEDPARVLERIKEVCACEIPQRFGFHPSQEIQVLTPMNKGVVGTLNLNAELQKVLNPQGKELARGGKSWRMGDKVIQVRNNYPKEVFNGDIGRILDIDSEEQRVTVEYDTGQVDYDYNELDELMPAYAISVHRSQGSEYPAIVVPLLPQHYLLLQRNLLYTALTRARKLAVLIGSKKAVAMAVRNDKVQKRYTCLQERLEAALKC